MAFFRTILIIAALLLGWFALRAESMARSAPVAPVAVGSGVGSGR